MVRINWLRNILKINSMKKSNELEVDFIKSNPLTEKERSELSAFIQKLKSKSGKKKMLKHKSHKKPVT